MNFLKPPIQDFLSLEERTAILHAIKDAESNTSGELRLFIESKSKLVNTLERAKEVFLNLQMQKTENRNAILIYIAYKDKEFAVFGDKNCWELFPKTFWKQRAKSLEYHFFHHHYLEGLMKNIQEIKTQFEIHFLQKNAKKNELPDEIIFGK